MGATVVVDKLSVCAASATLVDALSFTIRPGEVLALIGPQGERVHLRAAPRSRRATAQG